MRNGFRDEIPPLGHRIYEQVVTRWALAAKSGSQDPLRLSRQQSQLLTTSTPKWTQSTLSSTSRHSSAICTLPQSKLQCLTNGSYGSFIVKTQYELFFRHCDFVNFSCGHPEPSEVIITQRIDERVESRIPVSLASNLTRTSLTLHKIYKNLRHNFDSKSQKLI